MCKLWMRILCVSGFEHMQYDENKKKVKSVDTVVNFAVQL